MGGGGTPTCSPCTESGSGRWGAEWPVACGPHRTPGCGPWAVVLTGALGWQGCVWNHTVPLSMGLHLHHGLFFTLLKEFGRGNGEQLLESSQGRSGLLSSSYSLPLPNVLRPVLRRPACVLSFHSQPSVTSLWGRKRRVGVFTFTASVFRNSVREGARCILGRVHVEF